MHAGHGAVAGNSGYGGPAAALVMGRPGPSAMAPILPFVRLRKFPYVVSVGLRYRFFRVDADARFVLRDFIVPPYIGMRAWFSVRSWRFRAR